MPITIPDLVLEYEHQPAAAARTLRERLDENPVLFLDEAVDALRENLDTAGHAYLLRMLATDPLALERITDPSRFSERQAFEVLRRIQAIDTNTDIHLVRLLLVDDPSQNVRNAWHASRVLEMVSRLSDGKRVLSPLTALMRHSDPRVRSKATLLIGRINQNVRWLEARLSEPDARVRANAIEALWGVPSSEFRPALIGAAQDPDHRVAANAAVGLYRAGDLVSTRLLNAMTVHQESRFRAAAAWAMGETADPRFLPALSRTVSESRGPVLQNALRAMVRVRDRVSRLESMPALRVTAECDGTTLLVEVRSGDGLPIDWAPPTAFVVTQRGKELDMLSVQYEKRQQGPCYLLSLSVQERREMSLAVYTEQGKGDLRVR